MEEAEHPSLVVLAHDGKAIVKKHYAKANTCLESFKADTLNFDYATSIRSIFPDDSQS